MHHKHMSPCFHNIITRKHSSYMYTSIWTHIYVYIILCYIIFHIILYTKYTYAYAYIFSSNYSSREIFFLLVLMGLHKLMEIQVLKKNKWNKIVIISKHNKMYNSVFFIILSKLRKHIFISIDYKCFYEMTKYINILPKFRNLYYLLQHFLAWKWEKDKLT